MPKLTADVALVEAFLDALREARDAAEFERLTLGGDDLSDDRDQIRDWFDALVLKPTFYREPSALEELKGRQALARLQRRHPELWDEVALMETVDG